MNDETPFSRQREAEMLRQLAALRARVEELADLLAISEERSRKLIRRVKQLTAGMAEERKANSRMLVRLAELQAPPIVPKGWYVHRTDASQDDGGWAWSRDVAVVRAVAARAFRALAWAIETGERPPHEGDP